MSSSYEVRFPGARSVGSPAPGQTDQLSALQDWLDATLGDRGRVLALEPLAGGQSNPTFLLRMEGGELVLRAKPSGALVPSAHAVEREYRVQHALSGVAFPTPEVLALCTDERVFGATFYVMTRVPGRQFMDATLSGLARPERVRMFHSMIDTLAHLHSIDPREIGLADYGRAGNYFDRQLNRLSRQYLEFAPEPLADMRRLIERLYERVPQQDRTAIVHGDYRMDNILFQASGPGVAAVLDWELSTLGDPLADLTYLLMHWALPADGRSGLAGVDLAAIGLPTQAECAERYCRLTGRTGIPELAWYIAFHMFRVAVLYESIAARVRAGNAAGANAAALVASIPAIAAAALAFAVPGVETRL